MMTSDSASFLLSVIAPLSGCFVGLTDVPDPVFAQKMVGDGVSIDPTSVKLLAPIAGIVTYLHPAHHALTITSPAGVEVMVHIGLDTVTLKGKGFTPFVKTGDHVKLGQVLIEFDPDYIGQHATSLLTQVIITQGGTVQPISPPLKWVEAGVDTLFTVTPQNSATQRDQDRQKNSVCSDWVSIVNPSGLHARPAAVFAAEAKKYACDIWLWKGDKRNNAKSVMSIMELSIAAGDRVKVEGAGKEAETAVKALVELLQQGCHETQEAMVETDSIPADENPLSTIDHLTNSLTGVGASSGLAIGYVFQLRVHEANISETGQGEAQEMAALQHALDAAKKEIEALADTIPDTAKRAILLMQIELLQDPDLLVLAKQALSSGKSAAWSWKHAFSQWSERLAQNSNPLLRERANDIRDVGRRVLRWLTGEHSPALHSLPDESIVIAEDLTPSETMALPAEKVAGFCTHTGGTTSHVAILARSLGLPAICGIPLAALSLPNGTCVIMDGNQGIIWPNPTPEQLEQARQLLTLQQQRRKGADRYRHVLGQTRDGTRIQVVANIRSTDEAQAAIAAGAEGVGLLRSEFLFIQETSPTKAQQVTAYSAIAKTLGPNRPLVIRTLDVGGDKALPYLSLPKEDNPFLGIRGIRLCLKHPDLFRNQLRAILKAAPLTQLHIMFPMVSSIEEWRAAKAILDQVRQEQDAAVKVGIMVEVPSAALLAEAFAQEVDFFSIGTNDLTQYTLAMDRGHPELAKQADPLHPAVLKMIAMTCEAAKKYGRWVGVCGGLASDEKAAPLLVGMGVTELSASIPSITAVKAALSGWTYDECTTLAQRVLACTTTEQVKDCLYKSLHIQTAKTE